MGRKMRHVLMAQSWPADGEREYELCFERPNARRRQHAYVCVYLLRAPDGHGSRFALRLELPGEYVSLAQAQPAAFELAWRFFRGEVMPREYRISSIAKEYQVTGGARFRVDKRQWEPWLRIESRRAVNKGACQTFHEDNSPFYSNTFPTAEAAARFAVSFGERMVFGMVGGLKI